MLIKITNIPIIIFIGICVIIVLSLSVILDIDNKPNFINYQPIPKKIPKNVPPYIGSTRSLQSCNSQYAKCSGENVCVQVSGTDNIIYNGERVPSGKWCLPPGRKFCGSYTGRSVYTNDGWECQCLYPDLYNSGDKGDKGCMNPYACRDTTLNSEQSGNRLVNRFPIKLEIPKDDCKCDDSNEFCDKVYDTVNNVCVYKPGTVSWDPTDKNSLGLVIAKTPYDKVSDADYIIKSNDAKNDDPVWGCGCNQGKIRCGTQQADDLAREIPEIGKLCKDKQGKYIPLDDLEYQYVNYPNDPYRCHAEPCTITHTLNDNQVPRFNEFTSMCECEDESTKDQSSQDYVYSNITGTCLSTNNYDCLDDTIGGSTTDVAILNNTCACKKTAKKCKTYIGTPKPNSGTNAVCINKEGECSMPLKDDKTIWCDRRKGEELQYQTENPMDSYLQFCNSDVYYRGHNYPNCEDINSSMDNPTGSVCAFPCDPNPCGVYNFKTSTGKMPLCTSHSDSDNTSNGNQSYSHLCNCNP